jgi:hypothetical protein
VRQLRCSVWAVVAAVLLFDVAPSPSCGSGNRDRTGWLSVSAMDCSCVTGTVRVTVDDRFAAEITCGSAGVTSVEVSSGTHVVAATSGALVWPAQTQVATASRTTRVDLGCPAR